MSIISSNKEIKFVTPHNDVNVKAEFETISIDFTVTRDNRNKIGYTGGMDQDLVIPETFIDLSDGKLYKVTKIDEDAFSNIKTLRSVVIPNSVTTIGDYAFYSCLILASIDIPNSVTTIGENAFLGLGRLSTININKPKNSITGAPWGASKATVNWLE